MMGDYRIRWANVQHGNGRTLSTRRMCIAERRGRFFWWPVLNGKWREHECTAVADIERDKALRSPLPLPRVIP